MRNLLICILLALCAGNSGATCFHAEKDSNIQSLVHSERLERAKAEAQRQIDAGIIQGAVFAATGIPPTAIGNQRVHPEKKKMTVNSRFDIASVGKTFTASLCALLACDGKISLDDRFVKYLPESALGKDCDITVRDLAMHAGGFDNNKPYNSKDMKVFHRELLAMRPVRPRLGSIPKVVE